MKVATEGLTRKGKKRRKPNWYEEIQSKLANELETKKTLWQNHITDNTETSWQEHKNQGNEITAIVRMSKKIYLEDKILSLAEHLARHNHKDVEKLWEAINEKCNLSKA